MKNISLIAFILFCLVPMIASAQLYTTKSNSRSDLCYDPCVIGLRGTLIFLPEPNTYSYIEKKTIQVYALKLDTPINVIGDPQSEVNTDSFQNITQLQLAFDPTQMHLDQYVDKEIVVTGKLEESVTIHQYTKVYLVVENIRIATTTLPKG